MKTITIGIISSAILACSAFAGDDGTTTKDYKAPVPPAPPCFKDQEFQIDLFGSYINMTRQGHDDFFHAFNHDRERDGGGGGLGVNYFFLRYVGVGVDGDVNSTHHGLWDTTGKLIARIPIELGSFCMAPYAFGGGGVQTDGVTAGTYVAGAGVEFRVAAHVGIFGEGRYTWAAHEREDDNAQARLGVRLAF